MRGRSQKKTQDAIHVAQQPYNITECSTECQHSASLCSIRISF